MPNLQSMIEEYIKSQVINNGFVTEYRKPLVGYVSANHPLFKKLPELTYPRHLQPFDLLRDAKTVIAFFLPFEKSIIQANRKHKEVATEWAVAYTETNALLYEICRGLQSLLESKGYQANFAEPTNNFDKIELVSPWSHKHVAYIAGLGKFGLNRQLITDVGCSGRFSSIVTNAPLPSTSNVQEIVRGTEHIHSMCESCGWCQRKACPVEALKDDVWDKQRCWQELLRNEKMLGLNLAQCCGKCSIGPCSIL